jgi:hypothetical protein
MEAYFFRSRAWSIGCHVTGGFIAVGYLVVGIMIIPTLWSYTREPTGTLYSEEEMAQRAQEAESNPESARLLREHQDLIEQSASARRCLRVLVLGHSAKAAFWVLIGAMIYVSPIVAIRRAKGRAQKWKTSHCGMPWRKLDLPFAVIVVGFLNLEALVMLAMSLTLNTLDPEGSRHWMIEFCLFECLAIISLILLALHVRWRLHTRDWRLRLSEIPAKIGEQVRFEIYRESGKALDEGLRLELLGWKPTWNTKGDFPRRNAFMRAISGELRVEPPGAGAPKSVVGFLRIDGASLSPDPPPGQKRPRRMLPFLRVRSGWWRRCLFDIPVSAAYVISEALTPAVRQTGNGLV